MTDRPMNITGRLPIRSIRPIPTITPITSPMPTDEVIAALSPMPARVSMEGA